MNNRPRQVAQRLHAWMLLLPVSLLAAPTAFAHHPMGGATPETFWQGLLSGLGHPVIELDHFMMIVALGVLVASWRKPAGFIGAFIAGTFVGALAWDLHRINYLEAGVALSLILVGVAILMNTRMHRVVAMMALLAGGFVHGLAYAETIVGAETAPIVAYLLGFSVVEFVIASGVTALLLAMKKLAKPGHIAQQVTRYGAGLVASGIGAWGMVQAI